MAGFNYDQVRNHPSRDGFDYSSKNAFSAKVGEILPAYWCFAQPDDVFQLNYSWFTRTTPVNTAAYTRVREYFDFAFIPLRLLWRYAPEVLTQMTDNIQSSSSVLGADSFSGTLPNSSMDTGLNRFCFALYDCHLDEGKTPPAQTLSSFYYNMFGFSRSDLAAKLAYYLGIGPFYPHNQTTSGVVYDGYNPGTSVPAGKFPMSRRVNLYFSLFPFLAYQKFYSDYFRYTQWEKAQPSTFNMDYFIDGTFETPSMGSSNSTYYGNPTFWDLRYCNWPKDMFMGILPSAQFGDVATIDTGASSSKDDWYVRFSHLVNSGTGDVVTDGPSINGSGVNIKPYGTGTGTYPQVPQNTRLVVDYGDISASFNALQLRLMQVTQKWKEITISGDQNARDQIYKHFGVKLPAELSSMSKYIGGAGSNLDISEVVNTNLSNSDSVADIAGKGIGTGRGSHYFHAKEWGVLMCVYHAVPLLDYARQGIDPQFLYTQNTDFPIPEFDRIGYQSIPAVTFLNNYSIVPNSVGDKRYSEINLGYTSRYYDWKTKVDVVNGMFLTTADQWVAPVGYEYLSSYFKKLNSSAWTSGQLITSNFFKVNPAILDSIFVTSANGTWDTDQLMVNVQFDVKKVQNLSSSSIPY